MHLQKRKIETGLLSSQFVSNSNSLFFFKLEFCCLRIPFSALTNLLLVPLERQAFSTTHKGVVVQ